MFERLKRERQLKSIKGYLTDKYKVISLKNPEKLPEVNIFFDEYGLKNISLEAKIDEKNQIHFVVKFDSSILYHAITTNYDWFLNEVIF